MSQDELIQPIPASAKPSDYQQSQQERTRPISVTSANLYNSRQPEQQELLSQGTAPAVIRNTAFKQIHMSPNINGQLVDDEDGFDLHQTHIKERKF